MVVGFVVVLLLFFVGVFLLFVLFCFCFVFYRARMAFHDALLELQSTSTILRNSKFNMKREACNWFIKSFVLN